MRPALLAALSTLALALVAAAPAVTVDGDFTVVAEEECTAGPDADLLTAPDWQDLCTVSWRTVAADDDVPTTVEIRLDHVGEMGERVGPNHWSSRWAVDDCVVAVEHRDATTTAPAIDELHARCGEITRECDRVTGIDDLDVVNCRDVGDLVLDVPVTPPVITGTSVTWQLTFDGELAPLASRHLEGAVVDVDWSAAAYDVAVSTSEMPAGPGATVRINPYHPDMCVSGLCTSPFGDRIEGDRDYTIG